MTTQLECRWSGWPGAWCLDCGREDPREVMLAQGEVSYDCDLEQCACASPDEWLKCQHFGPVYDKPLPSLECPMASSPGPGSNRHNPYEGPAP